MEGDMYRAGMRVLGQELECKILGSGEQVKGQGVGAMPLGAGVGGDRWAWAWM